MKYCKTCKLTYQAPIDHCLFCNSTLEPVDSDMKSDQMPNYPAFKKSRHIARTFRKLIEFLVLFALVLCFFLDLTDETKGLSWSMYSMTSLLYVWYLCVLIGRKKKKIQKITSAAYATILLVLLIGLYAKVHFWAIDFILPIGILALNVTLMLYFVFAKRKALHDVVIYPLIASVYGMIPFVLLFCHTLTYTWPSLVCGLFSFAVFSGLMFFSSRQTKEELKRRLHL